MLSVPDVNPMRPDAPARPAQPTRPPGPHGRKRRQRSAGVALVQATAAGLAVGWHNPERFDPDTVLPSSGAAANVTPANAAWSAWVQVEAATAAALVLGCANLAVIAAAQCDIFYQLGIGPAGAEVPIAEFQTGAIISGTGSLPAFTVIVPLPNVGIPAGSRLAVRAYGTAAGIGSTGLFLQLFPPAGVALWEPWSDDYAGGAGNVAGNARTPAVPAYTTVNNGPGWTQLIAAAAATALLRTISRQVGVGGGVVELALGAPGAEQVAQRVGAPNAGGIVRPPGLLAPARPLRVLAGERLSARINPAAAATPTAVYLEPLTF